MPKLMRWRHLPFTKRALSISAITSKVEVASLGANQFPLILGERTAISLFRSLPATIFPCEGLIVTKYFPSPRAVVSGLQHQIVSASSCTNTTTITNSYLISIHADPFGGSLGIQSSLKSRRTYAKCGHRDTNQEHRSLVHVIPKELCYFLSDV